MSRERDIFVFMLKGKSAMNGRERFLGYVDDDVRYVSVTVRLSVELQALAKEKKITVNELINTALEVGFAAALEDKDLK